MEELKLWKDKIDKKLKELLKPFEPHQLYEAMAYYLFQEGKRIRPLFLMAITRELGGDLEDAALVGCALEMIHNYSLVHDDLPALDDDDERRGRPTCHRVFGEAMAILAGDALLTYAFEILSRPGAFRRVPPQQALEIVNVIAKKAGIWGMVSGQVLDIKGERDKEKVSLFKTAALFEASFLCAGICSGYEDRDSLERLGRKVGLLFQITDDILDRDGYYEAYGERALDIAKELHSQIEREVKEILPYGKTVEYLVHKIIGRVMP